MIVNNPNFRKSKYRGMRGLGSDPSINVTTIWTPTYGFLDTPGVAPIDNSGGTSSYQSPTLLGAPACSKDANPFVANSAECIAQLLANQQHDMGQANLANYNVDLYNCLNTFPQPTNCYERTFGLTPVGGYTGGVNILTQNAQQFVTGISPAGNAMPVTSPTTQTQQLQNAGGNPGGSGQQSFVDGAKNILSGSVGVLGHDIPIW